MTPTLKVAVSTIAIAASDAMPARSSQVSATAAASAAIVAPGRSPAVPPTASPIARPGKTACVSPSLMNSSPRRFTSTPTMPATTREHEHDEERPRP